MADLKDRYSDQKLNPANADFEKITSHYGDTADPSQEDANIKKLRELEANTSKPDESDRASSIADKEREGASPENRFGYDAPEKKEKTASNPDRRRKQLIGAGVGGGVLGGLLIALFSLLPLKVPGIMSMVTSQTMQRVEQITEKRAKTIIGRAILTKFGTHTGIVITGEGAFKTLVASMRTSGFEKRMAARGLVITQTPDGVKLTQNGRPLGGGKSLKNEQAIIDALEKDNISNKVLKDIVREDIPSWRWMKRAKFAKWLRIKYGVPRYGLTNSDNPDSEEKIKEMDAERAERAAARTSDNFRGLLSCILSGSCEAIDGSGEASAKEEEASETANDVDAAAEESVEAIRENGLGSSEETTKSISKLLVSKLGTKAIPIIGWIDLVATLDHFAHEAGDNDYVGKIAAYYKGAAYAAIYAEWSGYGSQVQLGAMDPEYAGALANELNDAEKAQAFQAIMGDASRGEAIETLVNSDKPSSAKQLYDSILNGPLGFSNKYIGHPLLNAYYETIGGGGFLGWVAGGLGDILGSIFSPITGVLGDLTPDSVKDLASEAVAKLGPFILKTFGLTIDEFDRGPKLMNNIMGGGVVSANEYCMEIGCRKLSSEQAYQQNRSVAMERAADTREKGVFYAMFDTDHPTSLTNRVAYSMPTSLEGGMSSVARAITSTPSRLASFFMPHSQADEIVSYEGLYGVSAYGATAADINQPLAPELMSGDTCPTTAEGEYNGCNIDTEVAEAMLCEFEPESEGCAEDTEDSGICYGTSSSLPEWTGFPTTINAPVGGPVNGTIDTAVANIKMGSGVAPSLRVLTADKPDFITVNEISETSLKGLEDAAPGYGAYRDPKPNDDNDNNAFGNAVMWRKDKWTLITGGRVKLVDNDNAIFKGREVVWDRFATWGIFKRNDGAIVPVISTHMMTNPEKFPRQHGNPEMTRIEQYQLGMEILIQLVGTLSEHGPVLVGGDFNSHANQGSWSAVPMMKTIDYNYVHDGAVMYQFFPKGTKAVSHRNVHIQSDHPAVRATIDMNGVGPGAVTAGGISSGTDESGDAGCEGGGTKLRIASFNVRGASHTEGAPSGSKAHWLTRIKLSLSVIQRKNLDVIGFQEFEPRQREYLVKSLPNYGITTQGKDSDSIMWNTDKFAAVDKGTWTTVYFGGPIEEPWVKLKDKSTGQEFYVLNVHDPINRGQGDDRTRYENALAHKALVKKLVLQAPVMLVGDFNSAYSNSSGAGAATNDQLTYCVLTSDKTMFDAYDLSVPRNAKCPNPPPRGTRNYIDHIYLTPGLEVSLFDDVPSGYEVNGSDHPTIFSDVTIPGAEDEGESSSAAGGWSWPLGQKAWKDHRASFLGSHYSGGGFLGNGSSSVDISWGDSDTGTPIYSMLDGVVKTQPLGRSSYRCTGTPNPSNNGGMLIESRVDGHVIQIAYAHGSDPKFHQGQPVKSGQQILKLGNVGNSCGSHLHMDATYDGKNVCLQDIFIALDKGKAPNMGELVGKATLTCAGRG